jgi:hypothetical protein
MNQWVHKIKGNRAYRNLNKTGFSETESNLAFENSTKPVVSETRRKLRFPKLKQL